MVKKTKSQPNHPVELLPSRKRTNDIIRGIEFVKIMNNINDKNVQLVNNLLTTFEQNLNEYLSDISAKIRESNTKIHCRDLNYILDTIIERIFNLKIFEGIRWQHDIEESTKRVLNRYFTNLKCYREIYDSKNTHIHIKKHMYDLCEDIKYIIDEKKRLQKNKYCNNIFPRVLKRWIDLRDVYYKNQRHEVFYFDHNCTIDYIMNNFSDKECNIGAKPRKAKVQTGNKLKGESKQGLVKASDTAPGPSLDTETALGPDKGPVTKVASDQEENEDDPNVTEETDFLMDIPFKLPPVEEPKLDTTYAAASLCGVSLIGAMIYKFKPFGFGSRAPGMRNGMGGYPFPHAANGDYDMGNFEYLQTGIPNNEYHLGYGPAADH